MKLFTCTALFKKISLNTGRGICSRTWVGLTLILAVPMSARYCLSRLILLWQVKIWQNWLSSFSRLQNNRTLGQPNLVSRVDAPLCSVCVKDPFKMILPTIPNFSASGCPLASKAKGRYEPTSSLNSGGGRSGGGGGSSTFSPRLGYDVGAMMSSDEIIEGGGGSAAKKMKSSLSDIGSVDNGEFSPDEKVLSVFSVHLRRRQQFNSPNDIAKKHRLSLVLVGLCDRR